jgi:hypothetical protein
MITFEKKGDPSPAVASETEENRFEQIRKLAAERHKKSGYRWHAPSRSADGRG